MKVNQSSAQGKYSEMLRLLKVMHWSVGVKLVLIISSIIFVMLTAMIYLATYFFRLDYELRVQEQNVKIAEVIGTNLEISIEGLITQGRLLAQTSANARQITDTNIAFFGLYRQASGTLGPIRQHSNETFVRKNALKTADLTTLILRYKDLFRKSFRGSTNIINVSSGFTIPMIGISFPMQKKERNGSVVVLLCPIEAFLDSFQSESSALIQTFMVDTRGKIIMHPDSDVMRAGADFSSLPIVVAMQKSRFRNGQIAYEDSEQNAYLGSFWKSSLGGFGIVSTVSEENAFAEVYNIRRRNIYLMIVAVSIAVIAVLWYSRRLVRPIRKLTDAARQIAGGHYKINIKAYAEDEIGVLTHSFNQMSKGLQERENLKDSFSRFVNKEIAEKSLHGKLKLGGERRQAALLFSDIRNFTNMSEKMRPEELVKFLNSYFSEMVGCIVKNKGSVDKFIGDAIMAHWGAVEAHKAPALAAVQSAIEMRRALVDFNKKRARNKAIRFGVGINYGPVVAGQIGSQERLEYTVIGDTVNLASRLEGLTKELKVDILISDSTFQSVRKSFRTEALGAIKVRGKEKAVKIHTVLGPMADPHGPSNLKELRSFLGLAAPPSKVKR